MADEKIRYTVKDYLGNPTSVPADKVEAFLKRQDELKAMAASLKTERHSDGLTRKERRAAYVRRREEIQDAVRVGNKRR